MVSIRLGVEKLVADENAVVPDNDLYQCALVLPCHNLFVIFWLIRAVFPRVFFYPADHEAQEVIPRGICKYL